MNLPAALLIGLFGAALVVRRRWVTWKKRDFAAVMGTYCAMIRPPEDQVNMMTQVEPEWKILLDLARWDFTRYIRHPDLYDEALDYVADPEHWKQLKADLVAEITGTKEEHEREP